MLESSPVDRVVSPAVQLRVPGKPPSLGGEGLPSPAERDPLALPVLLLNRFFVPLRVIPARRAFVLLYAGAACAVDEAGELFDFGSWRGLPVREADDGVATVGGLLRVPRVLNLLRYDRVPKVSIRLTRRNLLIRDGFQCQYCSLRPGVRNLNVDHVIPRSRGGPDTWENLVISCRGCNLRKGRRTPAEAGLTLLAEPRRPRWSTSAHILLASPAAFSEWQPFLRSHCA